MALIICEECGKEFSDKASACPNCGCPIDSMQEQEIKEEVQYKANDLECDVEINGNEVELYYDKKTFEVESHIITKMLFYIYLGFMIFLLLNTDKITGGVLMSTLILFLIGSFILSLPEKITPWYAKEKAKKNKIKERIERVRSFFEKKFPIYNDIKPEFKTIDVINETGKDKERMMFSIYMKAYKLNADAIVLNSDTVLTEVKGSVSTSVGGRVSGGTSSTNTFKVMATLVKY